MFRPENIQKVTLFFPKQVKDTLFMHLHESGVCEIAKNTVQANSVLTESIELLQYVHRMQNRFSPFVGKVHVNPEFKRTKHAFKQITSELAKTDTKSQVLLEKIHENELIIETAQDAIKTLNLLPKELQTQLLGKTKFCNVEVGILPTDEIANIKFKDAVYSTKIISDDHSLIIAFGQDKIEKLLFEHGFIRVDFEKTDKTPNQLIKSKTAQIKSARDAIETAKADLTKIAEKTMPHLLVYEEEVDVYVRELTGANQSTNYDSFSSVVCWVTESKKSEFPIYLWNVSKLMVIGH